MQTAFKTFNVLWAFFHAKWQIAAQQCAYLLFIAEHIFMDSVTPDDFILFMKAISFYLRRLQY